MPSEEFQVFPNVGVFTPWNHPEALNWIKRKKFN